MTLLKTPICEFGKPAPDFSLKGVDGKIWTLATCRGKKGLLVMFICNHCPYVKAIRPRLIEEVKVLSKLDINCVAIMSNDATEYPEDSFGNMKTTSDEWKFPFPYLYDETQIVAKAYGALCTPDFFGYNRELKLQYRGRLDQGVLDLPPLGYTHELLEAMTQIAKTGQGPSHQNPSMGCSIKWKTGAHIPHKS